MNAKLPYASLQDLEQVVRQCHRIAFTYKGTRYEAEPHRIGSAKRTNAIVAIMLIDGLGWREVPFAEIRGMEVLRGAFVRGEPEGKLYRLA